MSKYPTGYDEYWHKLCKNGLMTVWHATFVEMTNEQVVMQQMTKKGRDGEWANDINGQMTENGQMAKMGK